MPRGGDYTSRAATVAVRERERQVLSLYIRGVNFIQIGRQLQIDESTARKAFNRLVKRLPKADVELLRKLETERIADMRQRLWSEMAGRPDPADPTKTIRPDPGTVRELIDSAIKVGRHEAAIFGMDAPNKSEMVGTIGVQTLTPEELDIQLARLTAEEQDLFMMLLAKMQGRWVEQPPPVIEDQGSVETTATTVPGSDEPPVS